MWKIGADQRNITGLKTPYTVSNKLGAGSFGKIDEFKLFMIVPKVVILWRTILSGIEGMGEVFI